MTFARLVWSEWTKLRSVRARLAALVGAAIVMTLFSIMSAAGERRTCCATTVIGPGGQAVVDRYELLHRPLDGDGTLTVRVAAFTGLLPPPGRSFGRPSPPGAPLSEGHPGLEPWAKAGLIITADTRPGASYAAVMIAADHGVRFQYDYTHDVAGPAGPNPPTATAGLISGAATNGVVTDSGATGTQPQQWLRLVRAGDTITAYSSADGATWVRVGSARLSGLPATVQAGPFVTSPQDAQLTEHPFVTSGAVGPTLATATFADPAVEGAWPTAAWAGQTVGGSDDSLPGSATRLPDGGYQVTGSGDIAPAVGGVEGTGITVDHALAGGFVALIVVIALGAVSATSEYRRGLIQATLVATPRRGRVLAAKAVVIGGATFALTLPAAALSTVVGLRVLRANHNLLYPVSTLTAARVVVGTAAFLAIAAVVALAVGVIVRRSAVAITAVMVATVLPYLLFQALPATAAEWMLRVTPTAALAVQQTLPVYHQVAIAYTPVNGYYPLAPWAGFAVLCGYGATCLAVAAVLVRRRDV